MLGAGDGVGMPWGSVGGGTARRSKPERRRAGGGEVAKVAASVADRCGGKGRPARRNVSLSSSQAPATRSFGAPVNNLQWRWERRIFALTYGMLGREEDARDATQETFLAAFRNLRGFRGEAKVSSWLHRIAVNQCITRQRRAKVRNESALDDEGNTVYSQDDGNDFRSTDFRDVYGTILKHWANMPHNDVLGMMPLDAGPADEYWTVEDFDLDLFEP